MLRSASQLLLFAFLMFAPISAEAASRHALLIGNSAYTGSPALKNPANDAALMAKTLQQVGFEVTLLKDAGQKQMRRAMLDFSRRLRNDPGSVGLFYYAGHGLQVQGLNYMLPVSADIRDEDEVRFEGVDVNDFLTTMQNAGSRLNIIILDACRNNPYKRSFRSASRGLAPVQAASGTLIAYSTAPGSVAADGNGLNSPYTLALARYMKKAGLRVETVFKRVLASVEDMTQKQQTPWVTGAFRGEFYFRKGQQGTSGTAGSAGTGGSPSSSAPTDKSALDKLFWESIQGSKNPASYEAYLKEFPNGTFAGLAGIKIAELSTPQSRNTANSGRSNAPPADETAALPSPAYRPLFPRSSTRRLTRDQVKGLSCHKLWLARNEIFFRKGYCFKTEKGIRHFDNSGCTTSKLKLSPIENRNIRRIRSWELRKRCRATTENTRRPRP